MGARYPTTADPLDHRRWEVGSAGGEAGEGTYNLRSRACVDEQGGMFDRITNVCYGKEVLGKTVAVEYQGAGGGGPQQWLWLYPDLSSTVQAPFTAGVLPMPAWACPAGAAAAEPLADGLKRRLRGEVEGLPLPQMRLDRDYMSADDPEGLGRAVATFLLTTIKDAASPLTGMTSEQAFQYPEAPAIASLVHQRCGFGEGETRAAVGHFLAGGPGFDRDPHDVLAGGAEGGVRDIDVPPAEAPELVGTTVDGVYYVVGGDRAVALADPGLPLYLDKVLPDSFCPALQHLADTGQDGVLLTMSMRQSREVVSEFLTGAEAEEFIAGACQLRDLPRSQVSQVQRLYDLEHACARADRGRRHVPVQVGEGAFYCAYRGYDVGSEVDGAVLARSFEGAVPAGVYQYDRQLVAVGDGGEAAVLSPLQCQLDEVPATLPRLLATDFASLRVLGEGGDGATYLVDRACGSARALLCGLTRKSEGGRCVDRDSAACAQAPHTRWERKSGRCLPFFGEGVVVDDRAGERWLLRGSNKARLSSVPAGSCHIVDDLMLSAATLVMEAADLDKMVTVSAPEGSFFSILNAIGCRPPGDAGTSGTGGGAASVQGSGDGGGQSPSSSPSGGWGTTTLLAVAVLVGLVVLARRR